MPWSQTSPMEQRTQFIADYLRGLLCVTELCELYGVSRKTGYKWIDRYIRCGPAGLEEGSRRPQHSPNETAPEIVEAIIDARHRHPSWGAKKPGKPQQNGRHERMHRTLKAEATRPAAGNLAAQQRKFNRFREEYNQERPHEALDQETPASVYESSPREMPGKPPPLEYPDRFEVRYVSANGGIRWNRDWVNVSIVCAGEYVGLEEIDDGIWNVYFGPLKLGRLHERHMRIEDEYGRLKRK